ncbi:peptide chain release factor APG3, chloroplastic isoform X2 [Hevea brasiliensis]|uniref:peptide chain release factor APG3, chloroplastic isoform X2 n=1 Tax=Hevea brasiliensis TaxID=3981 RepID=UPI0025F5D802|nr:peptide chain release factor APG3, chloroplastic isoform X2 [Hevea brasiliensis]
MQSGSISRKKKKKYGLGTHFTKPTLVSYAALTKEEGNDEGTAELIAYEIGSLYDELKEFEEKLKVLLLPRDPLDARNVMLEGG